MFCRNCGKDIVATAEICIACGARPQAGRAFCPACGATLIERQGFSSQVRELDGQQCRNCGENIEIVRHVT